MSRFHNDRDAVKQGLKDRIEQLCRKLLPDGFRQGRFWISNNPVTGDYDKSPELKVALDKDIGAWIDWRSGDKGDVIKLVEYLKQCDFPTAMDFARDLIGLRSMTADQRKRFDERSVEAKRDSDDRAEREQLQAMKRAEQLFMGGMMDGSRAAAEAHARAYFRARRCALEDVPNRDLETMRFIAATEYWRGARYETDNRGGRRKVEAGPKFPAVLSAMRSPLGQQTAVHCTFLHPTEAKKAPLGKETAKLMLGPAKGSMIRISHGPEGQPPEMAREAHPLILCEGIEDGLSLAIAVPPARVWAAGSLIAMAHAPVHLDCISCVIVARDNDWGKKQAQEQFAQVLQQLAAAGKPITEIASHHGKDFNDLAQQEEEQQ